MSLVGERFIKETRRRGRPIGWRKREPHEELTTTIMISQDLKDIIASEQQKGETHNDTLLRLLREHALKKIELQRKVDQLTAQLQQVQPHGGVLV